MTEPNRGVGKLAGRLRTAGRRELIFGPILLIAAYGLIVATLAGMSPPSRQAPFFTPLLLLLNAAAGGWKQSDETDWYAEAMGFRHAAFAAFLILVLVNFPGSTLQHARGALAYIYLAFGCTLIQRATWALLNKAPPKVAEGNFATHPI